MALVRSLPGLDEDALSKVVDIVADAESDVAESVGKSFVTANCVANRAEKWDVFRNQ